MFGIDSSELAIIALVALLVIGPKDLPRVMRQVGQWLAKGRAMTRHVRAGFDTMMREAELEEMQKQWAAQNEAIMKATALPDLGAGLKNPLEDLSTDDWMTPLPTETPALPPPVAEEPPAPKPRRSRARPAADPDAPKPVRKRKPKADVTEPTP
ncbi:MAG: twin-arginine translocase subunit TatB [Alphaproteobacteria bacterium PA4]|nr:MAG: twin-arginine translocase subunit TatB [Alphaproteobacteria bacterium PA4]